MSNIKLIYYHYKGEKRKNKGIRRDCNTAYCNYGKIFIQNLRATISDIYDVL